MAFNKIFWPESVAGRGGGGGNEVEKWSLSTSGVIPIHCGGDLLKGEMECETC